MSFCRTMLGREKMKYSTTTTAMKMPHCLKASLPSVAAQRTQAWLQTARQGQGSNANSDKKFGPNT